MLESSSNTQSVSTLDSMGSETTIDDTQRLYLVSQSWARWLYAITIFVLNLSNGWAWLTYAGIEGKLVETYGISLDFENSYALIFFISTFVFIFPTIYLIDKTGLVVPVFFISVVQAIGSSIRIFSATKLLPLRFRPILLMIGQAILSITCPAIITLPTKVSATCFRKDERVLANSICTLGNFAGIMFVFAVVPTVYSNKKSLLMVEVVSSIPVYLGLLMSLMFARREFKEPIHTSTLSYKLQLKKLLTNRQFVLIMITFGVHLAVMSSIVTFYGHLMKNQGFTYLQNSAAVSGMIATGIIGAIIISNLIDKFGNGLVYTKVIIILQCIELALFSIICSYKVPYYSTVILKCFIAFFSVVIPPYLLDTAIILVNPIPEAVTTGLMWFSGQAFSLILGLAVNYQLPIKSNNKNFLHIIMTMDVPLIFVGLVFIFLFKKVNNE